MSITLTTKFSDGVVECRDRTNRLVATISQDADTNGYIVRPDNPDMADMEKRLNSYEAAEYYALVIAYEETARGY